MLPARRWRFERWGTGPDSSPSTAREQLLRRSLEIASGQPNNGSAVREIVDKAAEAGMYQLAMEAVTAFSSDASWDFYIAIQSLLRKPHVWRHLSQQFIGYCEERTLGGVYTRSSVGFNNHFADERSVALGRLGQYQFFMGRPERSIDLWSRADDPYDIDEVIEEMCELIGEHDPKHIDAAIALTDLMRTTTLRAKTLAMLSSYV
jgi:hypothetical protein